MRPLRIAAVLYVSRVSDAFKLEDLELLMKRCQARNAKAGLRGILLYSAGHFIQFLEGPKEALDETLGRIVQDHRHRDLEFLMKATTDQYLFDEWSMGHLNIDAVTVNQVKHLDVFEDLKSLEPVNRRSGEVHHVVLEALRLFREQLPAKDEALELERKAA